MPCLFFITSLTKQQRYPNIGAPRKVPSPQNIGVILWMPRQSTVRVCNHCLSMAKQGLNASCSSGHCSHAAHLHSFPPHPSLLAGSPADFLPAGRAGNQLLLLLTLTYVECHPWHQHHTDPHPTSSACSPTRHPIGMEQILLAVCV